MERTISLVEYSILQHPPWHYVPNNLSVVRLFHAAAINSVTAIPGHAQGLESILADTTQPITQAFTAFSIGTRVLPSEAVSLPMTHETTVYSTSYLLYQAT